VEKIADPAEGQTSGSLLFCVIDLAWSNDRLDEEVEAVF